MFSSSPPLLPNPNRVRRFALLGKFSAIALIFLLLQIPLHLTDGIRREREEYQRQATREVAGRWGESQNFVGPVLAVPYGFRDNVIHQRLVAGKVVQVEEHELSPAVAYFLPETFQVHGMLEPEIRHRGIYDVPIYLARMDVAAEFRPDFSAAGIEADRIDWDQAQICIGISDLRGLRTISPVHVSSGKDTVFESAVANSRESWPLAAKIQGLAAGSRVAVSFNVNLQGTQQFQLNPAGKSTVVTLESPWRDPSFIGAYLPSSHDLGPNGFRASWEVSHLSRGFGQSWTTRGGDTNAALVKLSSAGVGVEFALPASNYRMVDRALKYGNLFFLLIFATFFLFEMSFGLRIHPLQYAMVGAALALFFLGFLAMSEFAKLGLAYAGAAGACTTLIAAYSWTFLGSGARSAALGAGLAATYGVLYFVLRSQDYALAAGTLALFTMLALLMYFTRRLDWHRNNLAAPAQLSSA